MSIIFRRFLALFLSLMIVISSTQSAFATTSIGGWTAVDALIAGANTTINATKTAGGKVLTSAVTVAASASKVGKHLIKGGGQAAIAYAVVELLGEGIDWVLDPANNAVKYKDPAAVGGGGARTYKLNYTSRTFSTADAACRQWYIDGSTTEDKGWTYLGSSVSGDGTFTCSVRYATSSPRVAQGVWAVDTSVPVPDEYKYLPIDTVAAKVISNAEAGHGPSQEAVKAAALEGFAAGEHDAALDAAAVESDAGTDNPTDPNNPTDPQDPAAPFDPSSIIAAINSLKALLAGILSSITSLTDFFKSDPPPEPKPEDTELDIPLPDLPTPDTDINFGGSCPANFEFKGSIFGNPINIVLLDTAMFCDFLSTYVKYPVYAASSLFALYIIGGRKDV